MAGQTVIRQIGEGLGVLGAVIGAESLTLESHLSVPARWWTVLPGSLPS